MSHKKRTFRKKYIQVSKIVFITEVSQICFVMTEIFLYKNRILSTDYESLLELIHLSTKYIVCVCDYIFHLNCIFSCIMCSLSAVLIFAMCCRLVCGLGIKETVLGEYRK